MKIFLFILLTLICLVAPQQANAIAQHPQTGFFCPMGLATVDGCGQAPQPFLTPGVSGQVWRNDCFAVGGYINQYAGTTTDYTVPGRRPPYNVPMCDYPIGSTIPDAQLIDPAVTPIPGCTYNPTGTSIGSGILTCGGSVNGVMLAAVGTHGCTTFRITGSGTVSNMHSINDGHCIYDVNNPSLFTGPTAAGTAVSWISNTLDGNISQVPFQWGTCTPGSGTSSNCSATQGIQSMRGNQTGRYNSLVNFSSGPIFYSNTDITQPFIWDFNAISGWMMGGNKGDHAEAAKDFSSPGSSFREVNHNLFVQATLNNGASNAPWSQGLTGLMTVAGKYTFDGNVVITAFTGGMPVNATMTGSMGCGNPPTCTTNGSQFYVTSVGGGGTIVGTGPNFTCAGVTGLLYSVNVGGNATSAGIGGAWHGPAGSWFGMNLGSGTPPNPVVGFIDDGSTSPTPSGIPGSILTVTTRGTLDLLVPDGISGTGIPASTVVHAQSTGPLGGVGKYVVWTSGSPTSVATASENITYSISNIFAGGWSMPPTTCTTGTMITASTLKAFLDSGNVTIGGPSEIIGNYIDVSAGAGNSFTTNVNTNCPAGQPTTFRNNINMSTGNPDTGMNSWSPAATNC